MPATASRQAQMAKLLMEHRNSLYAYILACARNHNDAEDILQNVSLAVTESADQLQDDSGFLPWAREIARRRILAHFRRSRRELPVDPELAQRLAEAADRIEEKRPLSARMEALQRCLELLPSESRELICLRYDDDVENVEALAKKFGRTVQAIYARLKRIKAVPRDCVLPRPHRGGA